MITIRLLNDDDVAAYQRLRLEALQDSPTAFCSSYEDEVAMPFSTFAARVKENRVFGAFSEKNELIGTIGFVRETRTKCAHVASLVGMHVSPGFRRQGIGGSLLDHAIQFAREQGDVRSLKLSVTASNRDAARLYRSRGFEPWGIEPDSLYYNGQYFDEEYMIMRLED